MLSRIITLLVSVTIMPLFSYAQPEVGESAPLFSLSNHEGEKFSLESRRGHGWTVLFFYPKADTPGCTKQACAFRDAIEQVRAEGAEVYGISADSVDAQRAFHRKHALRFDLLADPEMVAIKAYGTKMPLVPMSKRWTFILDPQLVVRAVERDVDPMLDAKRVAAQLKRLKAE